MINSDSTDEDKAKEAAKAKERQQQVEEITECSESLMQRGFPDVYNMMREELQKQYQKETGQSYSLKRKRDLIDDLDDLDDLDEEDVDDNKPTLKSPRTPCQIQSSGNSNGLDQMKYMVRMTRKQ